MLDDESLRELLRKHYLKTVKLMESLLRDTGADAEFYTDMVWGDFWENCSKPGFEFKTSSKSYLYKMMRNKACDILAEYASQDHREVYLDVVEWHQVESANDPAVQAMALDPDEINARLGIQNIPKEIRQPHLWVNRKLLEALGRMSPTERLVLIAAAQDETDPTDAELATNINAHYKEFLNGKSKTPAAVKKARQRAEEALKKRLHEVSTDQQAMQEVGE